LVVEELRKLLKVLGESLVKFKNGLVFVFVCFLEGQGQFLEVEVEEVGDIPLLDIQPDVFELSLLPDIFYDIVVRDEQRFFVRFFVKSEDIVLVLED